MTTRRVAQQIRTVVATLALAGIAAACTTGGTSESATTKEETMDLEAVAEELIGAIETGDIEEVVALYIEDGTQHHPLAAEPIRGRDAIRASDGALLQAFPDATIQRRGVFAGESTVVVELVLVATNTGPLDLGDGQTLPPTGRRIEVPSVWVLDVSDDGLITEERAYFDSATFFRQLGLQE